MIDTVELRAWAELIVNNAKKYGVSTYESEELNRAKAIIELLDRLDAAEKVCKLLESHYGTYLNHEYCKALKEWQEVGR